MPVFRLHLVQSDCRSDSRIAGTNRHPTSRPVGQRLSAHIINVIASQIQPRQRFVARQGQFQHTNALVADAISVEFGITAVDFQTQPLQSMLLTKLLTVTMSWRRAQRHADAADSV